MKSFWYKFLVCVLSLGMLYPTWIATGTQKTKASTSVTGGGSVSAVVNGSGLKFDLKPLVIISQNNNDINTTDGIKIKINDSTTAQLQFDSGGGVTTTETGTVVVGAASETASSISIPVNTSSVSGDVVVVSGIKIKAVDTDIANTYLGSAQLQVSLDNNVTIFGSGDTINVDAQKPAITSVETQDLDTNGQIDAVKVSFSENVDDDTVEASVSASKFGLSDGYTNIVFNKTTNDDIEDNNYIYLKFDEKTIPDTDITPKLSYEQGTVVDLAGNLLDNTPNFSSVDKAAPIMPTNLSNTVANGRVNLSWDPSVSASDVSTYNIYRSSSPEIVVGSTSDTRYPDTPGYGIFTYYVSAVDSVGNESAKSDGVQIDLSQLPAPANFTVVLKDGEALLSWDAVGGATSYNVYYKKTTQAAWIGPVNVISNSTKVTGLETGVGYDFLVRAVSASGIGGDAIVSVSPGTSVVLASAPVAQEAVIAQPEAPSPQDTVTAPVEETQPEVGEIKGEETVATEEEDINWTPWIILFVLIVLAGAATGGYFYWFGNEEEEIVSEKVIEKTRKSNGKKSSSSKPSAKKSKRW